MEEENNPQEELRDFLIERLSEGCDICKTKNGITEWILKGKLCDKCKNKINSRFKVE